MSDVVLGVSPKASVELPTIDQIVAKREVPQPEPEAVVPTPVETPAPVLPPSDPQVSRGLAAIAERERELQNERQTLAAQKAELEGLAKYRTFHQKLEEDDALGALDALGVKFEDLSKAVLAGTGTRPFRKVEDRLAKEIEEVRTQVSTELEQIRALQQERLQLEFEAEAKREIASRSELVNLMGPSGVDALRGSFERHHKESGKVPTYQEVITEVEKDLVEFLTPFFTNETIRKRFLPAQQATEVTPSKVTPKKTLSNQDGATLSKIVPETENLIGDRRQRIDQIVAKSKRP